MCFYYPAIKHGDVYLLLFTKIKHFIYQVMNWMMVVIESILVNNLKGTALRLGTSAPVTSRLQMFITYIFRQQSEYEMHNGGRGSRAGIEK